MILFKAISLVKEKGFAYLVHKILTRLCAKNSNKDFITDPNPVDDFYFIETAPTNNPEIRTLRVKDNKDYAFATPFSFNLHVKEKKIMAVIHIFYPELCENIISYLLNIPYLTDLYISTNTEDKKEKILKYFLGYNNGNVEVRVFENRGRDIAPMIIGFKDIFEKYDYFIHLHSKKSPYGLEALNNWRYYLFENLLGSPEIVKSNLYLLEHQNVGVVFPQHSFDLRHAINWGYDFTLTKKLLKKAGITINSKQLLEFPSGSMFWARTDAIKPLLDLNLQFSDFPQESGQTDGTLAHAIERSLLYFCEASHYKWVKVVQSSLYPLKDTILRVKEENQLDNLMQKVYRPLFNTYIQKDHKLLKNVPEYIQYNTYPSSCKKPRLNLMLPTINSKEVFGGISTALKIYNALKDSLGDKFDYRIIVDIGLIDEASKENFPEYTFFTKVMDDSVSMQVVETVNHKELQLRQDDFFMATAWWTASSAYRLLEDQKRFFGVSHILIYLIQDYESNFYAWSAKWVFAENTYKESHKTVAIFNSEELAEFMSKRYQFTDTYYLPYEINENIKNNLKKIQRKKQIIFYGRPTVERNTFEIIVDALSLWQRRNPLTCKEWKIYSLGEEYQESFVSNVENITVVGKASLDEYATFLSESMIGISLMISPHPSYPPLEMAYAGIHTLTNSYDGKDLTVRSKNIHSLDIVSVEHIADEIENICDNILEKGYNSEFEKILPLTIQMKKFDKDHLINFFLDNNK